MYKAFIICLAVLLLTSCASPKAVQSHNTPSVRLGHETSFQQLLLHSLTLDYHACSQQGYLARRIFEARVLNDLDEETLIAMALKAQRQLQAQGLHVDITQQHTVERIIRDAGRSTVSDPMRFAANVHSRCEQDARQRDENILLAQ